MPKYDAEKFDPPAPVAFVTLRNPATGVSLSDVPMLLDTGADITFLPSRYLEDLDIEPDNDKIYEVQGFDGDSKLVRMAELELIFLRRKFAGQFLLVDEPVGILGRNILNQVPILFDGPRAKWDEYKR
ncbi:MAG TPA: retropepsin-like aspartic protease [Anaerolineales bacterium]